jgi:Calcineurin-like phosphoesterase
VHLSADRVRAVGRVALVYLVVAVVVAPLTAAWALTRTTVEDAIGVSPTTFSLTTRGHSELRLGIAGTVYVPRSAGPIGLVATVDGPISADGTVGGGDLAQYVSPAMLELYAGLFHDPERAVRGYVDLVVDEVRHQFLVAELALTLLGGSLLLVIARLLPVRPVPRRSVRLFAAAGLMLVVSVTLGVWQLATGSGSGPDTGVFVLPALHGTPATGATTNSPVLRLLLGSAIPKVQTLVDRQEAASARYSEQARAGLSAQRSLMTGPEPGEQAVLMQSDMHCNRTMIALQSTVRKMLSADHGSDVPSLLAITGDLTTNGTAAEKDCIDSEAAIAGDAPVAAVTGNHESELSADEMKSAGMKVLDGKTVDVGGTSVLGTGDPERTELFGGTARRGDLSEEDVGKELRRTASEHRPTLLLVHEAYAAAAFLGVTDMRAFLDARGPATVPHRDDVPDVPASAVFYGHWHRSVEPRVVWNSDGTWTLVMELNTSGGAVASPTIGHFSTPWTPPQQEASFPVVFLDKTTHLVTGYQIYAFDTHGSVTVEPRVQVGSPSRTPSQSANR